MVHHRSGLRVTGWRFGDLLSIAIAFSITLVLYLYLLGFIEGSPRMLTTYGRPSVRMFLDDLGIGFPTGKSARFYRDVLAGAVTASAISLVQLLLLFGVLAMGLRMLLVSFGAWSRGTVRPSPRTRNFLFGCIILLPLIGMLSTVIGILGSASMDPTATRHLIFGPTGLGIVGVLPAMGFYFLGDCTGR